MLPSTLVERVTEGVAAERVAERVTEGVAVSYSIYPGLGNHRGLPLVFFSKKRRFKPSYGHRLEVGHVDLPHSD